jgi:hypothetical protein
MCIPVPAFQAFRLSDDLYYCVREQKSIQVLPGGTPRQMMKVTPTDRPE